MTGTLTVATFNLYLGASLLPSYGAASVPEMTEALRAAYAGARRTDFPARAAAIAGLLAEAAPDVIGLQEVALWEQGPESDVDRCDFLEILLAELNRYAEYRVAATVGSPPLAFHTDGDLISFTDRDALLVRTGVELRDSGHEVFDARFRFPTRPGILCTKLRGWCWAEIGLDGLGVRLATTHLEAYNADVATAQAGELRERLGSRPDPVVLLGDLNSAPDQGSGAYDLLTAAGYRDPWPLLNGAAPGCTGEQKSTLDNEESTLYRRVDHVLCRGERLTPRRVRLLGAEQEQRLASGLWPSDHAGVVTEFDLT